jgi:hypothetical protein
MALADHASLRRYLSLPIAAAVVGAVLAMATAEALAASRSSRSPIPGFLLDRGRYTTIEIRGTRVETAPLGINDRGQMAGAYVNPSAPPNPQRSPMQPPMMAAGDARIRASRRRGRRRDHLTATIGPHENQARHPPALTPRATGRPPRKQRRARRPSRP